jgi:hypothetical protein
VVWERLEEVDQYRTWWPWLTSFDGGRLDVGERWRCTVQPALPYRVRFDVELTEVVKASSVAATVSGDVAGTARIALELEADGTSLQFLADLRGASRWLHWLERWAGPVARFGHDQIVDGALAELGRRVC